MEEHRAFKPLDTTANPLGLCQFYHTNPETAKSVPAPKPLATTHKVKCLLEKAKGQGQPYIIIIFEGGNVTLLGLLQELHLQYTLSCIPYSPLKRLNGARNPRYHAVPSTFTLLKMTAHF